MNVNPNNVPPGLRAVLVFADKWGIGDDFERERAINSAGVQDLQDLAHCLDGIHDGLLASWLTGEESERNPPTPEYLAVTNLTMAVHSAKAKLKRRP